MQYAAQVKELFPGIYRSPSPKSQQDLDWLWANGIRTVFCLQEGWSWLFGGFQGEKAWEAMGGSYVMTPQSNFFPPTKDECELLFRQISNAHRAGGVLIHCRAGVDRTGFLCAFIRWKMGFPPQAAWDYASANGMHIWYRLLWGKRFFEVTAE